MGGSRANTSLGVLQLVQAFLQEHASSKLAAKMATYFPEQLSERAENAGARANALVRTLEAQLYEDGSPLYTCLLYTSPSPRDVEESRMPSSA